MSKIPVHMFVSVSYSKQGGFKKKRKVRPCVGRTFFSLISYQKVFDVRGDCRQQVLRIGMSEHLTSIHRVTADSRFFVCQKFQNKTGSIKTGIVTVSVLVCRTVTIYHKGKGLKGI